MNVVLYGQDDVMGRINRALIAQGDSVIATDSEAEITRLFDADTDALSLVVIDMTATNAKDIYGFMKEKLDLPIIVVLGFKSGIR